MILAKLVNLVNLVNGEPGDSSPSVAVVGTVGLAVVPESIVVIEAFPSESTVETNVVAVVPDSAVVVELRATFEPLTGPKGLREPEATLEPRVHECVRHTSELYRCHVTYIGVALSPLG